MASLADLERHKLASNLGLTDEQASSYSLSQLRTLNYGTTNTTVGLLANIPATGTGSKSFYFATDDNGGTLYQDQTNGGAYTKITPGVSQAGGRELAYAQQSATASGTSPAWDVTGCTITFTVTNRPVHVTANVPVITSTAANGAYILQITDNANAETAGLIDICSPTAGNGSGGGNDLLERISAPGTYTRKLRAQTQSASAGATTSVVFSATRASHIKAVEA